MTYREIALTIVRHTFIQKQTKLSFRPRKLVTSGDHKTHAGDLETHAGDLETHAGDLEIYAGDLETHAGDLETHAGDLETHARILKLTNMPTQIASLVLHCNALWEDIPHG